jgi:hypothetical protein
MEATKLVNRDVYGITYDGASGQGLANVRLENPETGDVSTTQTVNDGAFTVTVASGYSGSCNVTVTDAGGHEVDSGEIEFGDAAPVEPPTAEGEHPSHPIWPPVEPHPEPVEEPDGA